MVVGTWQTAAAVMAAEMVAIEAGEQAELLLVNSRLAKVRRLHRGWEEKRPSALQCTGTGLPEQEPAHTHAQTVRELTKEHSAIRFRATAKRKRVRLAHAAAQRRGESRSGEAADDPDGGSP